MGVYGGVRCDEYGCDTEVEFPESCHGGDLHDMAFRAGWAYDGGNWWCPACAIKHPPEPEGNVG